MELVSIAKLRKKRKGLVKLMEADPDLMDEVDRQLHAWLLPGIREEIANIDIQIQERTAGESDIAEDKN